jgi:hypothetical protein
MAQHHDHLRAQDGGAIRDATGNYGPALFLAGAVNVLAAIIIV